MIYKLMQKHWFQIQLRAVKPKSEAEEKIDAILKNMVDINIQHKLFQENIKKNAAVMV